MHTVNLLILFRGTSNIVLNYEFTLSSRENYVSAMRLSFGLSFICNNFLQYIYLKTAILYMQYSF